MTAPPPLGRALRDADTFDEAALLCLGRALEITRSAIGEAGFRHGRALRAMLHLRPDDGYAGLYVLEAGADALTDPDEGDALLPSATVWERLVDAGAPLAVDVSAQTVGVLGAEPESLSWAQAPVDALNAPSQVRLLQRGATHLYVLPLHAPGGLAGMVSVEAQCIEAAGLHAFVWERCAADLESTVDLAGPYLAALPHDEPRADTDTLLPVVGPTMAPIVRVLRAFAAQDVTLLIRGETGTGKSRMARWCHANSPRAKGPFEVLDLLAVPAETQAGELFGWRKGAFSGAVRDHDGFVARAESGTLFIDEIDKLSADAQAALLTLLEERRYRVLGDDGPARTADVRFVVGTNIDLRAAVAEGRFREDLFYRINVLPMALPPLRERADEIPDWAAFMLQRHAPGASLSDDAAADLARQPWPGNLRELDNLVRRAHTLATLDATGRRIAVELSHVRAAQLLDATRHDTPLTPLLEAAAGFCAWLIDAEPTPDLADVDLAGALHGLLLAAACNAVEDRDAAFRLFGRGRLVDNRNHHKVLKRDLERLVALYEALDQPVPRPVELLLG